RSRVAVRTAGDRAAVSVSVAAISGSGSGWGGCHGRVDDIGLPTVEDLDQPVARRDPHVEPALLVVGLEGVDSRQLVVRRSHIPDVPQRLAAVLPGEDFIDHRLLLALESRIPNPDD